MMGEMRLRNGGGHDASSRLVLLGVVVLMMAVPFLSMLSVPSDGDISATEGSGTADDPYRGIVEVVLNSVDDAEFYVAVGTELDVVCTYSGFSIYQLSGDDIGLTLNSDIQCLGTIDAAGTAYIEFSDRRHVVSFIVTVHAVVMDENTPLVFESSPSEGTIQFIGS